MNIGKENSGYGNIGDKNGGGFNVGLMNFGDYNTGDYNLGSFNSGNRNYGDFNSGDFNFGNYNSGDFNFCDNSSGAFCTKNQPIYFFDKPSSITIEEWRSSHGYEILSRIRTTAWKNSTGLEQLNFKESCRELWKVLSLREKSSIMLIPNFNPDKFFMITGINIYD